MIKSVAGGEEIFSLIKSKAFVNLQSGGAAGLGVITCFSLIPNLIGFFWQS
jgi:hypothetical protein